MTEVKPVIDSFGCQVGVGVAYVFTILGNHYSLGHSYFFVFFFYFLSFGGGNFESCIGPGHQCLCFIHSCERRVSGTLLYSSVFLSLSLSIKSKGVDWLVKVEVCIGFYDDDDHHEVGVFGMYKSYFE